MLFCHTNPRIRLLRCSAIPFLMVLLGLASGLLAAPDKSGKTSPSSIGVTNAPLVFADPPKSIFVVPASPRDGRIRFFLNPRIFLLPPPLPLPPPPGSTEVHPLPTWWLAAFPAQPTIPWPLLITTPLKMARKAKCPRLTAVCGFAASKSKSRTTRSWSRALACGRNCISMEKRH